MRKHLGERHVSLSAAKTCQRPLQIFLVSLWPPLVLSRRSCDLFTFSPTNRLSLSQILVFILASYLDNLRKEQAAQEEATRRLIEQMGKNDLEDEKRRKEQREKADKLAAKLVLQEQAEVSF